MSYLIASYVIVVGGVAAYTASQWRQRAALRRQLQRRDAASPGAR